MLRFKLHQFHLGKTYYVLLPKLNLIQMQILTERLGKMGEPVGTSGLLSVRTKKGIVHVDPSGLCWSRADSADVILPAIPDLLSCPKAKISQKELESKYFIRPEAGVANYLRVLTRLESGPPWKALRATGACALAPDEHSVVAHLMKNVGRGCRIITDFPTPGSIECVFGRRHYFNSTIGSFEVGMTLRVAGSKRARNAYLPKDAILGIHEGVKVSSDETEDLLNGLGDWCFFSSE